MAFIIEQICGDYVTEDDTENEDSLEISGSKLHGYLGNLSHSCNEVIIEIQFVWMTFGEQSSNGVRLQICTR